MSFTFERLFLFFLPYSQSNAKDGTNQNLWLYSWTATVTKYISDRSMCPFFSVLSCCVYHNNSLDPCQTCQTMVRLSWTNFIISKTLLFDTKRQKYNADRWTTDNRKMNLKNSSKINIRYRFTRKLFKNFYIHKTRKINGWVFLKFILRKVNK